MFILGQGELEHRRVKHFYARTNKTKTYVTQISKHQRRSYILCRIFNRVNKAQESNPQHGSQHHDGPPDSEAGNWPCRDQHPSVPFEKSDSLPLTHPEVHHHISNTQEFHENIFRWLDNNGDLATIVSGASDARFILCSHLNSRISIQTSRILLSHTCSDMCLTVPIASTQKMNRTQLRYSTIGCTATRQCALTTRHMTCGVSRIQSTLEHTLM